MSKISKKNNFKYLFVALTSLLFFMALVNEIKNPFLDNMIEIVILLVLFVGVHSIKSERSWTYSVYVMIAILFLVFISRNFFTDSPIIGYIHIFLLLAFFMGSFHLSAMQIFTSQEVDENMIIGSVVLFLLLGLIWTMLYLLILYIFPDSFNGLEALRWQENFSKIAYFSFVTLTTLGFGDISPSNTVSQFFVYSEAIVGVFYMAVIVSALVAARVDSAKRDRNNK